MSMEEDLIDFSSENDNLIGNSSSPLQTWALEKHPSPGATNIQEEMDMACDSKHDGQFPQHESMEPEKARRKGKVNLRKSLAWDSAFLTDAGVLDAEELSCMMNGAEHVQKQNLSMIEEDVRQSSDSISTLESDTLTLEHIEADLFGDIRASIQKVMIPSNKDGSAKTDNGTNSSVKKTDLASNDRVKPKLPPRRIIGAQAGISKSQPKQITGTQRLGKGLKEDKSQVTQSITRTTDGASLKPPKISTRPQPVSAGVSKRASLDITRVRIDNESTKISTSFVRGAQIPKASASNNANRVLPKSAASNNASRVLPKPATSNNASRVLPKPALPMKHSSVGSSAATKIHVIRSSSESSGSTSSDKTGKSSLPAAKRKVDSRPIAQPSASSKLKAPSRAALKSKIPSGNSAVSAYLMSSKVNSTISPASSISEWSSASSSCSATTNQRSNKSRTSLETSSCRSFDSDSSTFDPKNHSSDWSSDKPENKGTTLPREILKQAGAISRPASMKTGLRMPTPKMGYFEGVKAVRTPNGTNSSSSSPLPKTEATIRIPKVNSNMKGRTVKVPLRANRKPETLKNPSPVSSSDKSNVSGNHSGPPSNISLFPELSLEVHHEISVANTSEKRDVVAKGSDPSDYIQSAGLVATKSENQCVVGNDTGACLVATKRVNQGIASTLDNKDVVAEGPDAAEPIAGDGLVRIKSENQRNDKEVVPQGPDTIEHVAGDGLVEIKSENQVIVNNNMHVIKSETLRNEKEVLAEGPDTVEHIASDGLVAIENENPVTENNETNMIKSENEVIANTLNNMEFVAEGPDTVECAGDDGLVTMMSENHVTVNNDTGVIKSESQRIASTSNNEEFVAEGPDTVEHIPGDGLNATKSQNQVIVNSHTIATKSESQRIICTLNNNELVSEGLDAVEDVAGNSFVVIKGEDQGKNNEMNLDSTGNIDINKIVSVEKDSVGENSRQNIDINEIVSVENDSVSENSRQSETLNRDEVGVQCNISYNSDILIQKDCTNLEVQVSGEFENAKIDNVVRGTYESNFNGAMPQCQTEDDVGRVDVKDDLDTLCSTNVEKNVSANQAEQLTSEVEQVSTTPFSDKIDSLMNKLAYMSLNTPEIAVRRMPFAVKNTSGDSLDSSEGVVQVVGKTDLDLPSLEFDHKENSL